MKPTFVRARVAVLTAAFLLSSPARGSGAQTLPPGSPRPVEDSHPPDSASSDPAGDWERANRLYGLEQPQDAERLYRRVLAARPNSVSARYNLGNALLRQGRAGAALQQYLGALRRSPRAADVRSNAAAARGALTAGLSPEERGVIAAPPGPPAAWLSPAEAAWAGLGAVYALGAMAALALLAPRARLVATGGAAVIFLAAALFAALFAWSRLAAPDALVVARAAEARAGPSASEAAVVSLPEGAAVHLVEEREGWAFVSLPNGLAGWVPRAEVGVVP